MGSYQDVGGGWLCPPSRDPLRSYWGGMDRSNSIPGVNRRGVYKGKCRGSRTMRGGAAKGGGRTYKECAAKRGVLLCGNKGWWGGIQQRKVLD
eukprot:764096-Hanusia_phi.AAC.1